jgi:hypothetical protein
LDRVFLCAPLPVIEKRGKRGPGKAHASARI